MGHSHGGDTETPARVHARARFLLLALVVPLLLATVLGLVVLWPADANPPTPDFMGGPARLADATVVKVDRRPCGGDAEPAEMFANDERIAEELEAAIEAVRQHGPNGAPASRAEELANTITAAEA